MKLVKGFWVPDYDEGIGDNIKDHRLLAGRPTYQLEQFQMAFPHIITFRHGVDIGAHVGLFSVMMLQCFVKVTAFEPMPEHAACYRKNVPNNPLLHEVALGDKEDRVQMATKGRVSFKARVRTTEPESAATVKMLTLDSFQLTDVDFIKIDCEGFELPVILGGEQTIRTQKPVILVEQKIGYKRYGSEEMAMSRLQEWGAHIMADSHGDYLLKWS